MRRPLLVICVVLAGLSPAAAYKPDPVEGQRLARRHCSICHGIGAATRSPDDTAPAFSAVARSANFRTRGAAFVLEPHRRMPVFGLTGDQAEDLAAYIRTLARR